MPNKDKWVRRFSVDATSRHKNGFTIYKITSVLFPIEAPETMTVVSVWKRYSDVQQLHKSMRSLHAGLHLQGTFPELPKYSYFKRFQQQVIEERSRSIKALLEFIAEHKLLFTSTDFVNFLQTGYPEPENRVEGVINTIRSSLHLPIEEVPPLEYQTSDDDSRSPVHSARTRTPEVNTAQVLHNDEVDFSISQIPIYEAADVEIRESPKQNPSQADSYESINSLESINSDLYEELNKVTIQKTTPSVKNKAVLPDLINFDAPSTSKFDDYHTMPRSISYTESDAVSLNSNFTLDTNSRRNSTVSAYSRKSVLSLSKVDCKTRTEDSYVFEAGYLLNMAARCEDMGDYHRAFEYYKSGIEKMLIGVQADTDPQRRAIIKEKTNKYLTYAESIYKNHLYDAEQGVLLERGDDTSQALLSQIPISMLRRPYEDLSLYRVLAVLGSSLMLVLHKTDQRCYAMKVIQKIPHNLTEFDEYFLQRTNDTRQPILPTNIPYMVPLHAYIETNNLIFLILSYAPGERLFEYIKNHVKSVPTTPAREVNLDNVFAEPIKTRKNSENITEATKAVKDLENYNLGDVCTNVESKSEVPSIVDNGDKLEKENNNFSVKTDNLDNMDVTVNELVVNSQKLLQNVDRALKEVPKLDSKEDLIKENVNVEILDKEISEDVCDNKEKVNEDISSINKAAPGARRELPPSAVRTWAAQLLVALESLHNAGVVCRDLNPRNILLGDGGQVILTYMLSYPDLHFVPRKHAGRGRGRRGQRGDVYTAPEVHAATFPDPDRDQSLDKVCDFWSFGAILYELLCGVPPPLEDFAGPRSPRLPPALPVDAHSLLAQLLTPELSQRLGAGREGVEEIKRHPYFQQVDWRDVYDGWSAPD